MNLLALDLGNKTGFAHSSGPSGTWDITPVRDETKGMRLIKLRKLLYEMYKEYGIDLVLWEAVRFGGKRAGGIVVQAEMQGVVKEMCLDHEIDYKGYSSTQIKKFATGKGKASKEEMILAATAYGVKPLDDNHADALHILALGTEEFAFNERSISQNL